MNVARPVASTIDAVHFGPLSFEDVQKISVKRIVSTITYDNLLNPVPGGLYDTALGAAPGKPCSTCRLDEQSCPGHYGHVELPTYVYHCIFMDQVYRLLRAQCIYCQRLRMSRIAVNRYACQLRLLQHGLIKEAREVLNLEDPATAASIDDSLNLRIDDDDESSGVIARQSAFVAKHLRKLSKTSFRANVLENEALQEARRGVIESFKAEIVKVPRCFSCKGISPKFRKNRASSIFVKPLKTKDKDHNLSNGVGLPVISLQMMNKAQEIQRQKAAKREQKRAFNEQTDEGVADLETSSDDNMPDIDMLQELEPAPDVSSEDEVNETSDLASANPLDMESGMKKRLKNRQTQSQEEEDENKQKFLDVSEAHARIVRLFDLEAEIMSLIYPSTISPNDNSSKGPSADMFFLRYLLVPPNKYRKEMKTSADMASEPPENTIYKNILNASQTVWQILRELKQGVSERSGLPLRNYNDLQRACVELQDQVNALIDNTKSPVRGRAAASLPEGIKQKLEKKEGLFRMHIMGKRVNFAARTVLSPDPNLETNEIGIPPVFARTLTYPEPVTAHNFEELKLAVVNGPDKWPGASAVEHENGQVISLRRKSEEDRTALANLLLAPSNSSMTGVRNKKVHRHLNNGDIVIMNRQPTLHKPSMMCHRAKVLTQENTLRMHYANCKTYNADFDGDEMNLHFPQNEIARAEALQIADTDHQYLSATAGEPLRGLIQDHISMSVWLTCTDMFFNRQEYQELLYCSLRPEDNHTTSERIETVPPAVLKPRRLWTGKQVITTILKNIKPPSHAPLFMKSKSHTPKDAWIGPTEEDMVRIEDGELLTGILDKKQIGPSSGGFIHTVHEAYGHVAAGKLMSTLSRLLTRMLNMRAFSCGVEDLILTSNGEILRKGEIKKCDPVGLEVASKYVMMESEEPQDDDTELLARLEAVLRDEKKQADLDTLMSKSTATLDGDLTDACLPNSLQKLFPQNQMQTMTASGAKGSPVNAKQITCNLGQQSLEGRRVPIMVSGKTLPCFKSLDPNIRCGGYIVDRFLTGLRPQEYFFHAMAGREGLIDTAVKTARSGYLQRCLAKGMEGLRAGYDSSVRDADGTLVQALYGEDGLETTRKALMDFSFQAKNFLSIYASLNVRSEGGRLLCEEAIERNSKALKKIKKPGNFAAWDPALSIYPPGSYAGSVSEEFYAASKKYIKENPDGKIKTKHQGDKPGTISKKNFENMLRINYVKSVIPPGEAVGVVAGQSLGEPSTQMTLNTFHLAGHSAANVTLGIPRLRDILMFARRTIPLPIMKLYPIAEISKENQETFVKSISRLSLAELIENAKVEEILGDHKSAETRIYRVTLEFYPAEDYTADHAIQISEVAAKLESSFVPHLESYIKNEIKRRKGGSGKKSDDALPEVGQSSGRVEEEVPRADAENEGGDSDVDDDGDDDATNAKRRMNLDEGLTFEDPDEEDAEAVRQGELDAEPMSESESEHEDEGYGGSEDSKSSDSEAGSEESGAPKKKSKQNQTNRENRIVNKHLRVGSFTFNEQTGKTCVVTFRFMAWEPKILVLDLVKSAAQNTLIHDIPGVKSCTTSVEKDKQNNDVNVILAAGVNLRAMQKYQDIINPHTLYTNDIWAFHSHYGVEAGRNLIIKELNDVFQGHGISVDYRHLTLVADYMTRDGGFKPFSRVGMKDNCSPFAKMSFETTMAFIGDAVQQGLCEDMSSPSARITVGKIGRMGTGMCDVFLPA